MVIPKLNIIKASRPAILSLLLFLSVVSGFAFRPISLKAKMDSTVLMGALGNLRLELIEEAGTKGRFPLLDSIPDGGYLSLCRDSVELRGILSCDTTEVGNGRVQINVNVALQAFNPGTYILPPFKYIAGNDTIFSDPTELTIIPVEVADDEDIYDYANVVGPIEEKVSDTIPDEIYYHWYWWLLALVLLALLIWLAIQFKRTGYFIKPKRKPTPYEVAVDQLQKLKRKKLWEGGNHKEYYTRLTEILRTYLQNRFGINAMEMTSSEILEALRNHESTKDKHDMLQDLLNTADFVKFAKVSPDADSNIRSFDSTARFVEATKPLENEEKDQKQVRKVNKRGKNKPKLSRRQKEALKKGGDR